MSVKQLHKIMTGALNTDGYKNFVIFEQRLVISCK